MAELIVTKQSALQPEVWKPWPRKECARCRAEALEANIPLDGLTRQYLELLLSGDCQSASRLILLDGAQSEIGIQSIYSQVFQRNRK